MSKKYIYFPKTLVLAMLLCSFSRAGVVQLDDENYSVEPGGSFVVHVMFDISETDVFAANAGFRLEASPIGNTVGTLSTSIDLVEQSSLSPYVFEQNAGFFDTGSGASVATGGDNTDDGLEDVLAPGKYYLAAVTWEASADALGSFELEFAQLGIVTVLTDTMDNDFLTGSRGATVRVPEPASLVLLLGGVTVLIVRHRS